MAQDEMATAQQTTREITLTIGLFFDGTGNNANNCGAHQAVCGAKHPAESDCSRLNQQLSGTAAGSYLGYYTNVHWLRTLYNQQMTPAAGAAQCAIYIAGIGTQDGAGDSLWGMGTGQGDSGVVSKTDHAVAALAGAIEGYLKRYADARSWVIKGLQFDIFGFSRGAAAARHFANRVFSQDHAIIAALQSGLAGVAFTGAPAGKTRFLGLFDTVAAIGTPVNGLDPHSADSGEVNLLLRPGVAEKVFHITAQHECRFNFVLNSVKPAWPELALPGVHSDIGGGYHPAGHDACFLTRPQLVTVPLSTPDDKTSVYQQASEQLREMASFPAIAPLLKAGEIHIETWHDARMPADRYGMAQKRSGAAAVLDRPTRNDWSKVVLRVMLDAAQEAGVVFTPLDETAADFSLPAELNGLCEKAIAMGRAVRNGRAAPGFTSEEIAMLAEKYIHCSANWNKVTRDSCGMVTGAVSAVKLATFTNRPDERWQRTVYDMDGKQRFY